MTDDGVFLGGGAYPGNRKVWTIPNIQGYGRTAGSMYQWSRWGHWDTGGCFFTEPSDGGNQLGDSGGAYGVDRAALRIDLSKYSPYINHTSSRSFYPDHYTVEYWIKYK